MLLLPCFARTQESVAVTEITPTTLVFATSSGNVVVSVGQDGALLVGTPSAGSTEAISRALAGRTQSAARYLVISPEAVEQSQGDAGWGKRGAFVAMQENALRRLGGDVMGAPPPLSPRLLQLGVDRPRIAFSQVLAFDLNGEAIHIVHQQPGYSDADFLAHFHLAKTVYFGEVYPGDGYPEIDAAQGGGLEGVLKTLQGWTDKSFHIVPARGKVTDGQSVKAFCDMIVTVRDRVKAMASAGKTEDQIVAAHPTAEFDARWGHGRVSPDRFVREMYEQGRMR
ncbi:MAG TPA: hypothetical protein VLC12_15090 [Terriglobales bacterium]|nr:hypothetical protein [Terriglobales bacterium]